MTATDTIHADHARSAGQIEGVIGTLAALADGATVMLTC